MLEFFSGLISTPTLGALFALCVLAAVAISISNYWRLRHFKGPLLGATSKLWMMKATLHGDMHLAVADVCQKYGSLARIGPNDLVTCDPEIIRKMGAVRSPYRRSEWYNATAFDHHVSHVFCELDEARHVDLRNKLTPGYSGRDNEHLEESIDSCLDELFRLIQRKYTSSDSKLRTVDFARLASFLTVDIIYALAFGSPMGFLEKDEDINGHFAGEKLMLPVFEWLSTLPILEKTLRIPWISRFAMPTPRDKSGIGLIMGHAKRVVARRYGPEKEVKKDMLGSFVEQGITQREAEQETVLQMYHSQNILEDPFANLAGSDTTATAVRATVLFVCTNPRIYTKLQAELDKADAEHRLTHPIITDAEAKPLPYLQACIKEGLRMWPPVLGLMQKTVPPSGDHLRDQFVPGGTNIGYCAWGLHRNVDIFGDDAAIFRPERWLETEGESLAEMNRTLDLVFGAGRYACLGKAIALIELGKTFAELFRRYDITLVDPSVPWKSLNRNGLFLQEDMFVRISDRVRK